MQATENNKISVIMGIYNCADTLPAAIDSILAQTYTDWQLILCDDCSTDNTYSVAQEYKNKYPDKIILIKNDRNMRLAYSLNHCLKYATGTYVARMDGDDISANDRFEKQIRYLQEHPEVQLVGTAMQWFDDQYGKTKVLYKPEHTDKWIMHKCIPFHHATIMTYKSVYDQLNGYTVAERTKRAQDYDLWFRFFAAGFTGDNIHEALYYVREDDAAFKRRKPEVYWNSFKTTCIGYKLLNYPPHWIIKEFLLTVIKMCTPTFIYRWSRNMQKSGSSSL